MTESSAPLSAPDSPGGEPAAVGDRVGPYWLTAYLGRGADGTVFRALDTADGSEVAIKFIRAGGDSAALRSRLRREAGLLAQLSHPNIVRLIEFADDDRRPYLVIEFVGGLNLAEVIQQSGRLAFPRALDVAIDLAEGLQCAHELGIVHRDVKPANVLVTKEGTPKLADLGTGTSLHAGDADPLRRAVVGTALYMAPEQVERPGEVDHRADIYALGATFYQMLTGRVPFEGENFQEVLFAKARAELDPDALEPPHLVCSSVPAAASGVVRRMLAYEPAQRHADYGELLRDLFGLRAATAALPRAPSPRSEAATLVLGPRRSDAETTFRQCRELLATGRVGEARAALSPLKSVFRESEDFWLLSVEAALSPAEALALAREATGHLPGSAALRGQRAALEREQPPSASAAARKCLFCGESRPDGPVPCGGCGGVESLDDPGRWASHAPARPERIVQAAGDFEASLAGRPNPLWSLAAGLARLNLGQFAEAAAHLREAERQRPGLAGVRAQLDWLARRTSSTPPRRVLLADGDADARADLAAGLIALRFEVVAVGTLDEARLALERRRPDAVVADIDLPGGGFELCAAVRARPESARTPVVLVSARDGVFHRLRGRLAGATAHLPKPADPEAVARAVADALARAAR